MTDPQPIPSATIMLLRDGVQGLEVFMVKRHRAIDFAAGAYVFPGGKLDPSDAAVSAAVPPIHQIDTIETAYRVAAIRETFEECGVLLCRDTFSNEIPPAIRVQALARRYRTSIERREITFAQMLADEKLLPACECIVPFAHWVTPLALPKRYDTKFFLAAAPSDQLAEHDGRETVDSSWVRPADILAAAQSGKATLVFATKLNLQKLTRTADVASALATAARESIVTVTPELASTDRGPVLRIPLSAGYGIEEEAIGTMAMP